MKRSSYRKAFERCLVYGPGYVRIDGGKYTASTLPSQVGRKVWVRRVPCLPGYYELVEQTVEGNIRQPISVVAALSVAEHVVI